MRVLLLTQFYWPEARSAPTNLARVAESLQNAGDEVRVVTGFPNHPFGKIYDGYRLRWRQWEEVGGVPVLRVPLFTDHSLSAVRRAVHYSSFAFSAATIGAWLTRGFKAEVILVYLPPLTNWLPIRILKFLHRAPAVYWVTDLWPEALLAVGVRARPWVIRAIRSLDSAVNRQAAMICVNSPGLKRRLVEKGVPPERLEIVTDWADESLFFPAEPDMQLAREHGLAGKFNVMYGGTLGPAQGLDTVLEAATLLRDLPDLQFVLVGEGEDRARLERRASEHELANVRFIPRQPMDQIHRFFAIADVLFVHLKPDPMFELQIPSKTMAYMACGRPVLCGIRGPAAELVEESGGGISCTPGDPGSLSAAVRQLYGLAPEARRQLGERARETYLARYTLSVQSQRIRDLLSRVVGGTRAAA